VAIKTFSHTDIHASQNPIISLLEKGAAHAPLFKMTLRQQCIQPLKLTALANSFSPQAELLHFPAHMDAPAFANQPTCVTLLDLIPLVMSDMYKSATASWRFHFARFLEHRAITRASLVLCISECTARDAVRLLKVPEEKIAVTPLAVDLSIFESPADKEETLQKFRLNAPYFLYVGGIDPRKNVETLLRAHDEVCQRAQEQGRVRPLLALAGKIKNDKQYQHIEACLQTLPHRDRIKELGFVSDPELAALYRNASAFVFPSLYEGFGFPILEAFAAQCPVICSNNSSLPEVAADAALTIDPTQSSQLAEAMSQIVLSPELRSSLIAKGLKRVPLFSWDTTAAKTMAAYERYFSGK